jgi:hypothetical protein
VVFSLYHPFFVQLSVGDGLPTQICQLCVSLVNTYHAFKLRCETSDMTLRQYLNNVQTKEQPFQV